MYFTSMSTSLSSSTEQPLSPKSPPPPPGLLDFCGPRKQMVKIQVLEREIALLQKELKSLEGQGLHPASRCCKELDTFVGSGSDPFTPTNQTISKSHGFWKRIRLRLLCVVSLPWVCCSRCCQPLGKRRVKGCRRSGGCCCCCLKTKTERCCCNVGNCIVCVPCDCCCHRCCRQ